jgi:hypothetical protein
MFGLFELLQVAGVDDPDADGDGWVRSAERMQRAISALATSLQKRFSVITNPDEKMVERAWDARRDRVRLEREAHRKAWLERARNMAADEFRKQNYGQVVELLSPFEDILSGSDRRKIGLARKRAVPPKE